MYDDDVSGSLFVACLLVVNAVLSSHMYTCRPLCLSCWLACMVGPAKDEDDTYHQAITLDVWLHALSLQVSFARRRPEVPQGTSSQTACVLLVAVALAQQTGVGTSARLSGITMWAQNTPPSQTLSSRQRTWQK